MSISRRSFLSASAIAPVAAAAQERNGAPPLIPLDAFEIARRHRIVRNRPTPGFFEGMLLGNGDLGVCITVRPDALGLHIGKEDSWDIRVSENHYRHVVTFPQLLKMWERASEEAKRQGKLDLVYLEREIEFFREYTDKVTASYSKSWPRPWPCGTVWVHWDPTEIQVVEQSLDPANGLFRLELDHNRERVNLSCFVNTKTGHVCLFSDKTAPFGSVVYYPNLDASARLPPPEIDAESGAENAVFSGFQLFPAMPPGPDGRESPPSDKDRNFALSAVVQGAWSIEGLQQAQQTLKGTRPSDLSGWFEDQARIFLRSKQPQRLRVDIALFTPRDHADSRAAARAEARRLSASAEDRIFRESERYWRDFWSCSAVEFEDKELERLWYHNQYWLACCLRPGKVAPGLFGNWTSGKIGTAWHGDYHMNYNTQQVFWGVFSSNHPEQHLPYIDLCEDLLPLSEKYAREKFQMPGAFFPHSAYPVPSQTIAYPAPPWGYEICETPWTVQSLWWHYLYTLDDAVLKRVYPLLKAASQFLAAYVKADNSGNYHIIPTVSPENWGFTVDYRLNKDCIMDLALARFVLDATAKAADQLALDADERKQWAKIAASFAEYPTAKGPDGEVWVDVRNAPPGWVYNVPVTLAPVFPGEQVGLGIGERHMQLARRTAETVRLEGGNDIVYQPLIRARLGMLDLHWFKREVRYCQMPNGIVQDRVRMIGGRYRDSLDFDFMTHMGVWTENLSLPAVLNECMLQSYTGTLRLFPNTRNLGSARFRNLRAAGAFLVSAGWDGKAVTGIEVLSERGATMRLLNPWPAAAIQVEKLPANNRIQARIQNDVIEFPTDPGASYAIRAARA